MSLDELHPRPGSNRASRLDSGEDSPPLEQEHFEQVLDEALERLAAGEALAPALPSYRERIADADWPRFLGTLRAQEYRFRLDGGEDVALDPILEELDEPARAEFLRVLADARVARGVLPHRIEPGCEIRGRWLVLRRLGSGGQAHVFAAWDRELELEVALKVFDEPLSAAGKPWGDAALAESRLLARLKSRHVVNVLDVLREEGLTIVVMGLVRGLSLRKALDDLRDGERSGADPRTRVQRLRAALKHPTEGEHVDLLATPGWFRAAARMTLAMAQTLQAAHAGGIAHRDLNPKNVMLVGGGEPVLLDFGLAARRGRHGSRGWTFPYVAPESLGEPEVADEARADLYQLGLVLYELLTLERAFALRETESTNAVLFRVARGQFTPPRRISAAIPEALEAICLHALATRPGERYASASEVVEDLQRFLRGLPPRTAPLRLRARLTMLGRRGARSPALIALALVGLALVVPRVLAEDTWRPPRVRGLVENAEEGRLELVSSGQVLLRGDWLLGAEIHCYRPTWLYSFRLYGDDPEEDRLSVVPTAVHLAERAELVEGAVQLAPGRHTIHCLDLREAPPRTGLLLLFTPEERAVLTDLRHELAARATRFEEARLAELPTLLARLLGNTRGQTVSEVDPAVLRRLQEHALARRDSAEAHDLWEALGIQEVRFVFPVVDREKEPSDE